MSIGTIWTYRDLIKREQGLEAAIEFEQVVKKYQAEQIAIEQERIIKLLEDSRELRGHIYFWEEFGENDTEGRDRKERAIALIKEKK